MKGLPTSLVTDAHAYTREDVPWTLGQYHSKLIHYLSGGGMSTFGRTIRQERVRRSHRRFLLVSAVLAALWLLFYII